MNKPQIGIIDDEFGRKNGILLVNKPKGLTSHDVVAHFRKEFNMKKIGHAGALDPFAEGLLVILVGKNTKDSDKFLTMDKAYEAEIVLGIGTTTGDIEGKITSTKLKAQKNQTEIDLVLNSFQPSYNQYVPVFSSVKVKGQKLRKLASAADKFEIVDEDGTKSVQFYKNDKITQTLELPSKEVKIYDIKLLSLESRNAEEVLKVYRHAESIDIDEKSELQVAKIYVKCSKGTYIRQLAMDLGEKLGIGASLVSLKRTELGEFKLDHAVKLVSS